MDFYSFSISASKLNERGTMFRHMSGMMVANNEAEAIGKATQQAFIEFPMEHGWGNHSAAVLLQTRFIASHMIESIKGAQ